MPVAPALEGMQAPDLPVFSVDEFQNKLLGIPPTQASLPFAL